MKVKELRNEKKSLITAIEIVQNDQNMEKRKHMNIANNRKPNQNKNTARGQHSGKITKVGQFRQVINIPF